MIAGAELNSGVVGYITQDLQNNMWPNGRLERFDEIPAVRAYSSSRRGYDPENGQLLQQQLASNASIADFYYYVEEALRVYQAYWVPSDYDPWVGELPHAFIIQKGMKLVNPDTGAVYTISEVVVDNYGKPTKEVRLSGDNPETSAPAGVDDLMFHRDQGVAFSRSAPRTTAGVDFESGATRTDTPTAWVAYIDFSVLEEIPAVSDPDSPRPTRIGWNHQFRETISGVNPSMVTHIYGQALDARIRFDLWGANSTQAEDLVQWFYDFMATYNWVFRHNGVLRVLFLKRGLDQPVGKWRQSMWHRPVDFMIRTERLFTATHRRLDQIMLHAELMTTDQRSSGTGRMLYGGTTGRIGIYVDNR